MLEQEARAGDRRAILEAGLTRRLPEGTLVHRLRGHAPAEHLTGAAALGAPPVACSLSSGRMNPAGIPLFYGALEIETAVVEACDADRKSLAFTHGAFALRRPALVVDLVDIPEVPSLFDAEHRHLRSAIGFLRNFTLEVSRPFARDGRIHIEYVPTQIVTEWLRARFAPGEGRRLDGVLYGSARNPGGANLALFIDNSGACDLDGGLSGAKEILVLREQHRLHGGVPSPGKAG